MTYQVALSFEDGVTRFISCAPDQTVADASYRARINIPLDCRDGACGTCKAFCESGEYDGGFYIDDALSDSEAASGYVLPCSMKPRSDLVLQIASTSAVAKTQAATYTGTLTRLERLSPTTMSLSVQIPNREALTFLPGQYVNIEVPGTGQTRSYSFSSAPDDPELSFLIKLTPGGLMSEHLTGAAAVGDEVRFTGPLGSFFLRETERPALLLAGGTGLAPILAILRSLVQSGSTRPMRLVYGISTDDDLVELETLAALAADLPELSWDYCVSDPASTAPHKGYVMSLISPEHLHDGDVAVYLCGPPPMVEAVREHFSDAGLVPTGFYYEKFALSAGAGEATEPAAAEAADAASIAAEPAVAAEVVADAESVAAPAAITPQTEPVAPPEPAAVPVGAPQREPLLVAAGGASRLVAGQELFAGRELTALGQGVPADPEGAAALARTVARQSVFASGNGSGPMPPPLAEGTVQVAGEGRSVAGQRLFGERETQPLVAPAPQVAAGGYEIGEEHPSVHESDAIFEARQALEFGALELTIGRLSHQQLTGYRLLAESTLPYVEGDHFTDAAAYTESNAAFHDYLFGQTGNEHLLAAYQALGVKGHMDQVLRHATWCHPRVATDHIEIVEAFEAGDRVRARTLIAEHAERSKATMRRAMADAEQAQRLPFVTPGRFTGKVVVVTGAAQGIGEHTARRIAAEGGTLVLVDRAEQLVADLAAELQSGGREATAVPADLESWDGATAMAQAALDAYGRIDVLVNNVGGAIWFKPFTEFEPEQIRAEIDRSLMTTLWSCRAVLPSMTARGRGVIVNVSSAATRGIHRIPYSAAKGAINAITASLALEYADAGIRVAATAPGGTEAPPRRISRGGSDLANDQEQEWYQAHIDQTIAHSVLGRYGTLDEQAAAICFLASDEASYITGTVLPVAGGDLG